MHGSARKREEVNLYTTETFRDWFVCGCSSITHSIATALPCCTALHNSRQGQAMQNLMAAICCKNLGLHVLYSQGVWTFVDQRQLRWQREEGRPWHGVVMSWCRAAEGHRWPKRLWCEAHKHFLQKARDQVTIVICGFCGPFRKFFCSAWCNGQVGWRDLIQSQWSKVWNWVWRFGTQEEIPSNVGGTCSQGALSGCGGCRHVSIPQLNFGVCGTLRF